LRTSENAGTLTLRAREVSYVLSLGDPRGSHETIEVQMNERR
jgi:hypothetical protein